tara:strand:- start:286 stop:552 length:267 start_codon:yes stop_codon:yes gene_type:complete
LSKIVDLTSVGKLHICLFILCVIDFGVKSIFFSNTERYLQNFFNLALGLFNAIDIIFKIPEKYGQSIDIMIEAKMKEKSIKKLYDQYI